MSIKLGEAAIEITDDYLDFRKSANDAFDSLDELYKRSKTFDCKYVGTYILLISICIHSDKMNNDYGVGTHSDYIK